MRGEERRSSVQPLCQRYDVEITWVGPLDVLIRLSVRIRRRRQEEQQQHFSRLEIWPFIPSPQAFPGPPGKRWLRAWRIDVSPTLRPGFNVGISLLTILVRDSSSS